MSGVNVQEHIREAVMQPLPQLRSLPAMLPPEGAVRIELEEGVPFTVDHVVPLAEGGSGNPDNLALACFHCNRRKANRLTALDPDTKKQVPLFNPRQDEWSEHFMWSADGLQVIGLTAVGRATIWR